MRRGPTLRAILFDWDGTLVDSAEASYRSYVRLFSSFGIRFDRALFEATYSPDWYRTYALVGLPRDRWSEADARWLGLYDGEQPQLLPGAAEAVARVREAGLAVAIVTSGSRSRVTREIAAFGMDGLFQALVCAEDSVRKKPDPDRSAWVSRASTSPRTGRPVSATAPRMSRWRGRRASSPWAFPDAFPTARP